MSLRTHTLRLASTLPEGDVRSELEKLAAGPDWSYYAVYSERSQRLDLQIICRVTRFSAMGELNKLIEYIQTLALHATKKGNEEARRLKGLNGVTSRVKFHADGAEIDGKGLMLRWTWSGDLVDTDGKMDPKGHWGLYFENAGFEFVA